MLNDYERALKTVRQEHRGHPDREVIETRLERTRSMLEPVLTLCGEQSRSRRNILRVARALTAERPTIYVPTCPDYDHANGQYTFRGLGQGTSLITDRHIEFLKGITSLTRHAHVLFVIANQEADDEEIRRAVKVDREEFLVRVHASLHHTRETIAPLGWEVAFMTEAIPEFLEREAATARTLEADPAKRARLSTECAARMNLYSKIHASMPIALMQQRTVRTAAQYLTIGEYAASQGGLVCNHTTTNLTWYGETDVGVLHNPISVY